MLLVIAHSSAARQSLRNVCNGYPDVVIRRFGRAVTFRETELGALLALRLREKHATAVQLERTEALNEFRDVPDRVREAAVAYEARDHRSTPYAAFVTGTAHPSVEDLRNVDL
ncbi:MAG: hypothetical protein ABEJ58_05610 [Halodesulfurarchaeum sp.]